MHGKTYIYWYELKIWSVNLGSQKYGESIACNMDGSLTANVESINWWGMCALCCLAQQSHNHLFFGYPLYYQILGTLLAEEIRRSALNKVTARNWLGLNTQRGIIRTSGIWFSSLCWLLSFFMYGVRGIEEFFRRKSLNSLELPAKLANDFCACISSCLLETC